MNKSFDVVTKKDKKPLAVLSKSSKVDAIFKLEGTALLNVVCKKQKKRQLQSFTIKASCV